MTGRLRQRSYEAKDGSGKRTVYEVEIDEVGPSLRNASAKVTKVTRTSTGNGGPGQAEADPWASSPAGGVLGRTSFLISHTAKRPLWPVSRGGRLLGPAVVKRLAWAATRRPRR